VKGVCIQPTGRKAIIAACFSSFLLCVVCSGCAPQPDSRREEQSPPRLEPHRLPGAERVAQPLQARGEPPPTPSIPMKTPQRNSGEQGAICVIDDSADMSDGPDGFSVSNGTWPILAYLTPHLGCSRCCTGSAFRARGTGCAAPCTTNVPSLTATSPLIKTLDDAVAGIGRENFFFVTNGLDWPTEGGDRTFRVEMNVGAILAKWVQSGPGKGVVIGIVQDNRHRPRRPNLVLGLIGRPIPTTTCELTPNNVPEIFRIRTQMFLNPEGALDRGSLTIYPTVQLRGKSLKGAFIQAFEVGTGGVVRLPATLLKAIEEPKMAITVKLNSRERAPFCWGLNVEAASGDRLQTTCVQSSGSTVCTFDVPPLSNWPRGGLRLSLKTAPTPPDWIAQWVTDRKHAIRTSVDAFESEAQVARRFQVARPGAQTIDSLVIIADTARN